MLRIGEAHPTEHHVGGHEPVVFIAMAVFDGVGEGLLDGLLALERVFLRDIPRAQLPPSDDLALVGMLEAGEDLQERGFAGAVGPDQTRVLFV